eukprot:9265945-Pyramimonas_sp.AAC.1
MHPRRPDVPATEAAQESCKPKTVPEASNIARRKEGSKTGQEAPRRPKRPQGQPRLGPTTAARRPRGPEDGSKKAQKGK